MVGKAIKFAGLLLLAAALGGCATHPPSPQAYLKPQKLPVKPQSPPQAHNGSLFASNAHVSLFQDHRLWRAGDLVTIDIAQNASASTNDNSQIQRQSSNNLSAKALLGITPTAGHLNGGQFSPTISTSSLSKFKGQGKTSASNNVQAEVSSVVTKVEPNDVLALYGRTDVNVNGDVRTIEISGYARAQDIGANNTISSNDISNMNVQYVGSGPTQSAHQVPWLTRVLNKFWPF